MSKSMQISWSKSFVADENADTAVPRLAVLKRFHAARIPKLSVLKSKY